MNRAMPRDGATERANELLTIITALMVTEGRGGHRVFGLDESIKLV